MAQGKPKYDESVEDVKTKLQFDLFYIENMSLKTDIKDFIQNCFSSFCLEKDITVKRNTEKWYGEKKTLIIVPTYNEMDNIKKSITCPFQGLGIKKGLNILVVDDNSLTARELC
ncbi:MAG: hypothetical protein IPG53_19925 [Ignavibacteriales bacterium]|nr:hypothetical protein [Ignavibacteriales bacterium]